MDKLEIAHVKATFPKHVREALSEMNASDWGVVEFFDRAEFCISMARERRLGNTYALKYYRRSLDKATQTVQKFGNDFSSKDPLLLININTLLGELEQELIQLRTL